MERLEKFSPDQIKIVNNAVAMAEELVCNFFKMSVNQWLRHRYDIKTLADLGKNEMVDGRLAQILLYEGQPKDAPLGSSAYDLYKICLQDHVIISTLKISSGLDLFPFALFIVTHELVHIVRFSKYLVNFYASPEEKIEEEARVHEKTHEILSELQFPGIKNVLEKTLHTPID
jgi:hypothetical protein